MIKEIICTALLGIVVGAIDVLPMIKMKLDKYSIASAFIFYFILLLFTATKGLRKKTCQ